MLFTKNMKPDMESNKILEVREHEILMIEQTKISLAAIDDKKYETI